MGILRFSNKIALTIISSIFTIACIKAQEKIIDQIVAVVGNDVVLQSEIENQVLQIMSQGYDTDMDLSCEVLEQLLIQKLLIHQAKVDSIEVNALQVETELDNRLNYFINQIGSKKRLEEYYKKSLIEIKEDLRDMIAEQILAETMQNQILGEIKVTPAEVKKFYNKIPKDSLPYIESELEIRQIMLYPPFSDEAIYDVRQRLLELRKRILEGEKFSTLAILYSEDPGTATKGGEMGMIDKDQLVPEFAKAAMKLKINAVSNIVETEFGYHIIQLIDKEDNRINARHILMKPKISTEDRIKSYNKLDSIAQVVRVDSLTFGKAAKIYSDDELSKNNEGLMVNPATHDTKYKLNELNKPDYYAVKDLKIGQISEPYESFDKNGKTVFKIVQIKSKSVPHRANLEDDYNLISQYVQAQKQEDIIREWIEDKQRQAYIQINDKYKTCKFSSSGWIKE